MRRSPFGLPFPVALAVAFAVVALSAVLYHEPWRDEVQFWIIARYSRSVAELQHNLIYANQTRLWPFCLYVLTRLCPQLWAMQVSHVLIAAAAVGVVAALAPFPRHAKALFAFGYYPLFEYGIISRAYGLGLLLTAACCALVSHRRRPHLALGFLLMLLAQTSAFAVIVAVAIGLAEAADLMFGRRLSTDAPTVPWRAGLAAALLLGGTALSIIQMVAPSDGRWQFRWDGSLDRTAVINTASLVWRAYVPVPRIGLRFWNTNFLDDARLLQALLGLLLATWTLVWSAGRPAALVLFSSGAAATLLFAHTNHFTYARHIGHLFIICLAAAWLSATAKQWSASALRDRMARLASRARPAEGLAALLAVHVACGLLAVGMDVRYPFSGGLRVAKMIRDRGYTDAVLAVDPGSIGPPVVVHLDRPFYAPNSGRWGRFVIHDNRMRRLSRDELVGDVVALARETGRPVLLLSRRPIGLPLLHLASVQAIVESYHVYLVPAASEGRQTASSTRSRPAE